MKELNKMYYDDVLCDSLSDVLIKTIVEVYLLVSHV